MNVAKFKVRPSSFAGHKERNGQLLHVSDNPGEVGFFSNKTKYHQQMFFHEGIVLYAGFV